MRALLGLMTIRDGAGKTHNYDLRRGGEQSSYPGRGAGPLGRSLCCAASATSALCRAAQVGTPGVLLLLPKPARCVRISGLLRSVLNNGGTILFASCLLELSSAELLRELL